MTTQSSTHVFHVPTAKVKAEVREDEETASAPEIWRLLFAQCVYERVQASDFNALVSQLWTEHKLGGATLVDQLLCCRVRQSSAADPLVVVYLECLLQSRKTSLADCLDALLRHSRFRQHVPTQDPANSPELECAVIMFAARQVLTNAQAVATSHVRNLLHALLEWLRAVIKFDQVLIDSHGVQTCDAIGVLAVSVLENAEIAKITTALKSTMLLKYLSSTLPQFIALWSQGGSSAAAENAARLIIATKSRPGLEDKKSAEDEKATALAQANLQVESILDLVTIPTRPAMFVFILSLIFARPISDDVSVLHFLQSRYKLDHQLDSETLVIDLIVGGFDVLSCVSARKEGEQTLLPYKSFLINKIPLWLSSLAVSMFSIDRLEMCIGQALSKVDNVTFPPPSLGLMSDNGLQDVRQDFVNACAIQSVVRPTSVTGVLAEPPTSAPTGPADRIMPQTLLEQVNTDSDKLITVASDLTKMDGNVGARASVVAQVIRSLCVSKDMMALKPICDFLSARPHCLDIMTQFMAPVVLVQPLCELLDEWRYDDDQVEYQPVYEEFAAVFLLAYAIITRYDLSPKTIGLDPQSFMIRYLQTSADLRSPDSLSEEDKKCFTTWTKGLLNPDSITDEVLSCCKPQDLYLLAPTIFGYLILAVVNKVILAEAVKTPLEYLCEPFLVPSVIGILHWLMRLSWKSKNMHQARPSAEQLVAFNLLMRICKPPTETSELHKSVITVMAAPCLRYIKRLARQYNMNQAVIEQVVTYLHGFGSFQRTLLEPAADLGTDMKTMGSMENMLRSSIQSLVSWAALAAVNPVQAPPAYDPRLLYQTLHINGATSVLALMLDEVKKQSASNSGIAPVAIDIVAALICIPTPDSQAGQTDWMHLGTSQVGGRMSLREALRLQYDEAPKLVRQDLTHVELVVRLHRHVETQLNMLASVAAGAGGGAADGVDGMNAQVMLSDLGAMAAVSDDAAAAAAAAAVVAAVSAGDAGAIVGDAMDFTGTSGIDITDTDMDLGLGLDLGTSTDVDLLGGAGNDDDIFAGLMGDSDMNFNDW